MKLTHFVVRIGLLCILLFLLHTQQSRAAGVTIVTHGYQASSGHPAWLDAMGNGIAVRAGSSALVYGLDIASPTPLNYEYGSNLTASGRESSLWRAPVQDLWDIRDLSFSMDGSRVVIYAGSVEKLGDAVWVVNVSSSRIEGRYPTVWSNSELHGAARLSPDNRRLYLARSDASNYRYSIQCLDLTTGQQLWQTEPERDYGLTTLDISPDGQVLASGSGFEDPAIRVWEAATGKPLHRLDGHTGWVCKLAFTRDGRRLISAASDQSIRFWDTRNWTEGRVLRGHTDEVQAVAISEPAQLAASAGKDGNLML